MVKNLVIVESPNKIKKIKGFLKNSGDQKDHQDFEVISSVGHIRDLEKKGDYRLGINLETMEPMYKVIPEKENVVAELNEFTKNAQNIYLATDPDREGEAIAWHIKEVIKKNLNKDKKVERIVFNEISKEAILNSLKNPREINKDLIDSQEARRMLDRIIGFRLSFLTRKKISAPSSGRVKSSVLKLIIDKEDEIKRFVPEKWWTIEHEINKDDKLINVDDKKNSLIKYKSRGEAEAIHSLLQNKFDFLKQVKREITINPPKVLEMSTYLMGVYSRFGYSNSRATFVSQKLYEEGLITYPRTDSKRISNSFIDSAKKYISSKFGDLFSPPKVIKQAKNVQDAHEGLRPVDVNVHPDNLDVKKMGKSEIKVYRYIWETTLKSLMKPGKNFSIKNIYLNNGIRFVRKFSIPSFLGFRVLDGNIEDNNKLIKEGQSNFQIKDKKDIKVLDHETPTPSRYNQSSIIKKMKDEGIGRPSTYSSVVSGLKKYNYIDFAEKNFMPTELGDAANKLLQENFKDIVNEKYTSSMESDLDDIANSKKDKIKYLKEFWDFFETRIELTDKIIEKRIPEFVGRKCPDDNGSLVYKWGRYGKFIGCQNFPVCRYIEALEKKSPEIVPDRKCPKCESDLVYRQSKRRGNSKFIGCSNYPECTFIEKIPKTT